MREAASEVASVFSIELSAPFLMLATLATTISPHSWCLTIFSFSRFISLVQGNPIPFVVMYTLGNILSILSSMFLAGPKRQWKKMTSDNR